MDHSHQLEATAYMVYEYAQILNTASYSYQDGNLLLASNEMFPVQST